MAQYDVTYKCGCTRTENLLGKNKDRLYHIARATEIICPDCKKKQANEEAEQQRIARGLAVLNGTVKQVAWANTIRERAFKQLYFMMPKLNEEGLEIADDIKNKMIEKKDASWWIDNRYDLPNAPTGHATDDDRDIIYNLKKFMRVFKLMHMW